MEDDRVAILEAQLSQAKLIAEEADKKYEEVDKNFSVTLRQQLVRDLLGVWRVCQTELGLIFCVNFWFSALIDWMIIDMETHLDSSYRKPY